MKLFIIGNGFDLAHNMKTSYKDFYNYLIEEYKVNKDIDYYLQNIDFDLDEEIMLNENLAGLLVSAINETSGGDWSDFETTLGKLDYSEMIDRNFDDFDNPFEYTSLNEQTGNAVYKAFSEIKKLFNDWLETITIDNVRTNHKFLKFVNTNLDIFLSFNYTKVLEEKYKCLKITHIHGTSDGEIEVGHGSINNVDEEPSFDIGILGAETYFEKIHELLRKKTENAISKNKDFFDMIKTGVSEIYSIGFSFSDVDMVYIEEIVNRINSNEVIWYFDTFDSIQKRDVYKSKIIKCNYKGRFSTFNLFE